MARSKKELARDNLELEDGWTQAQSKWAVEASQHKRTKEQLADVTKERDDLRRQLSNIRTNFENLHRAVHPDSWRNPWPLELRLPNMGIAATGGVSINK